MRRSLCAGSFSFIRVESPRLVESHFLQPAQSTASSFPFREVSAPVCDLSVRVHQASLCRILPRGPPTSTDKLFPHGRLAGTKCVFTEHNQHCKGEPCASTAFQTPRPRLSESRTITSTSTMSASVATESAPCGAFDALVVSLICKNG